MKLLMRIIIEGLGMKLVFDKFLSRSVSLFLIDFLLLEAMMTLGRDFTFICV